MQPPQRTFPAVYVALFMSVNATTLSLRASVSLGAKRLESYARRDAETRRHGDCKRYVKRGCYPDTSQDTTALPLRIVLTIRNPSSPFV